MLMRRCNSEVDPIWFWIQTSAACRNRGSRAPSPSPLPPPPSPPFSASPPSPLCSLLFTSTRRSGCARPSPHHAHLRPPPPRRLHPPRLPLHPLLPGGSDNTDPL